MFDAMIDLSMQEYHDNVFRQNFQFHIIISIEIIEKK